MKLLWKNGRRKKSNWHFCREVFRRIVWIGMIVLHFVKTMRIVNISIQLARITICTRGERRVVENSPRNTWSVWRRKGKRKRRIMSPFPSSPSRVKSIQFFFFLLFFRSLSMQQRADRKQERGVEEEKIGLSGLLDRQRWLCRLSQ